MTENQDKLSKAVSDALRHRPGMYGIELDEHGWASIDELIKGLKKESKDWSELNPSVIEKMIAESKKTRHEIMDSKIRALHGHSVPGRIEMMESIPPDTLYHGTTDASGSLILSEGLSSMNRQYVHLSQDACTAFNVGKRKSGHVVILKIDSKEASLNGHKFYKTSSNVWLSDNIPSTYIQVREDGNCE